MDASGITHQNPGEAVHKGVSEYPSRWQENFKDIASTVLSTVSVHPADVRL